MFGNELFIQFSVRLSWAFISLLCASLLSVLRVGSLDLIVLVPDHNLSFYSPPLASKNGRKYERRSSICQ